MVGVVRHLGQEPPHRAVDLVENNIVEAVRNNIFGDSTGTTLTAGNNNQLGVDFTTVLETEMVGGVTAPLLTDNGGAV